MKVFSHKILAIFDLCVAAVAISYPALFAEVFYPQLTPTGIILAVELLGWWRFGRGLCVLYAATRDQNMIGWVWLASAPLHGAAISLLPPSVYTLAWHGLHLILSLITLRCIDLSSRETKI